MLKYLQYVQVVHNLMDVKEFNRTVTTIYGGQAFIENFCFISFLQLRAAFPLIDKEKTTFLPFVYAGRHANR
jgi:hypothetical protein